MGWVFVPISPVIAQCAFIDIAGVICSLSVVLLSGEFLYPGNLVLIHTNPSMLNNAIYSLMQLLMSLL